MSLDNFIPLSITIAGLIALLIERRENAAMGATDHFHVKGLEARIDRARREVHIFVKDCPSFSRALGTPHCRTQN